MVQTSSLDYRPYVTPIYKAILTRLANQDQDQVGQIMLLNLLVFFKI